jgi:subtilisin family serine protease
LPFPLGSLTGKIAFILRSQAVGGCTFETKLNGVAAAGAIAGLIYTRPDRPVPFPGFAAGTATLPGLILESADGLAIKKMLAAQPDLNVTLNFLLASVAASSDGVADFSSKGPNVNGSIKPDLVAVGTDFYTAAESTVETGELYGATGYVITDGTSFAAPLVAGAAALLKGARPGLTAAQVPGFFKDATFGVPAGQAERTYSPRAGVTIVRDANFGVPHVYGVTRSDTMFGAGYAGSLSVAGSGNASSQSGGAGGVAGTGGATLVAASEGFGLRPTRLDMASLTVSVESRKRRDPPAEIARDISHPR